MRVYDVSIVSMIWPGPAGELGVDGGHRGARTFPLGVGVGVGVGVGGHLHTSETCPKNKIPDAPLWMGEEA